MILHDNEALSITLSFNGGLSDRHKVEFYDVAQALISFERSLALTTHLVLNNEIITQAPALKGASIYAQPPEDGSWKFKAIVSIAAGAYALGTAPRDSPIGHLIFSVYDYVVSESLGVHVDYSKSLGELYREAEKNKAALPRVSQDKADSLMEKCSTAIRELHRPIYKSRSATSATLNGNSFGEEYRVKAVLDIKTYNYLDSTIVGDAYIDVFGRVSSYNGNTFKGRVYIPEEGRPIPFELVKSGRTKTVLGLIVKSLSESVLDERSANGFLFFRVLKVTSALGHLKAYYVYNAFDLL